MQRTIVNNRDPRTRRLGTSAPGAASQPEPEPTATAATGPRKFILVVEADSATAIEVRGGRLLELPMEANHTDIAILRTLRRFHDKEASHAVE